MDVRPKTHSRRAAFSVLRPKSKLQCLALLLGLSLLLNVTFLILMVQRRGRQAIVGHRQPGADQSGATADEPRKARLSPRVVTDGLPQGYRMILRGHPGSIVAVSFSADRSKLGVITDCGYATVWNPDSGELLWETEIAGGDRGSGLVNSLAFSASGDQLAYAVGQESIAPNSFVIHLVHLRTSGEKTVRDDQSFVTAGGYYCLAFSPDGRMIASGGRNGVELFDIQALSARGTLTAQNRHFYSDVSYSATGTLLLANTSTLPVLFEAHSGRIAAQLTGKSKHPDRPSCVVLSPDASRIATGGRDNRLTLWDAATGQEIFSIKEGLGSAFSNESCRVEFVADGKSILTASLDDPGSRIFIRRRSVVDGKLLGEVETVQPHAGCPWVHPSLFTPACALLALIGVKVETRYVPEPDMGIISVREGVVAIFDTAQLLGDLIHPAPAGP
jgi:WD40 repeat protein